MRTRGFTLIELLVVISIISLLSSIVLATVQSARDKADTAYRVKTIEEYVKGVVLYREDKNSYPWGYSPPPLTGYVCMASTNCGGVPPALVFNALVDPYIKLQPAFKTLTDSAPGSLNGPYYFCNAVNSDSSCAQATITWPEKGSNQSCNIPGLTPKILSASPHTALTLCGVDFDPL